MVAMPAFNEDRYIGSLVLKVKKYADEVVVVDDGSADRTSEIAELGGAEVIRHEFNRGKGAAIQTILKAAKDTDVDVLVILDADSQHDADEIPFLLTGIQEGFDLVIGSRAQRKKSIPVYRRIGQRILLQFSRFLVPHTISDSESGFRAFSRRAINELILVQDGFAVEAEMLAVATEKHLKTTEVPISVRYLRDSSTLNPFRHGLGVLAQIIGMISDRRPLSFFGIIGLVLSIVGLVVGIRALTLYQSTHVIPTGSTMVAVLLIIMGGLCGFTGIILYAISKKR